MSVRELLEDLGEAQVPGVASGGFAMMKGAPGTGWAPPPQVKQKPKGPAGSDIWADNLGEVIVTETYRGKTGGKIGPKTRTLRGVRMPQKHPNTQKFILRGPRRGVFYAERRQDYYRRWGAKGVGQDVFTSFVGMDASGDHGVKIQLKNKPLAVKEVRRLLGPKWA